MTLVTCFFFAFSWKNFHKGSIVPSPSRYWSEASSQNLKSCVISLNVFWFTIRSITLRGKRGGSEGWR